MKTVILAEKPNQAKLYAEAFQKYQKNDGYFEVSDPLFDEGVITWGFGHLVELKLPSDYKDEWKQWNLENLPIFPETMQYKVSADKKKQFNIVKQQLKSADQIVIATDIDREGEAIGRLIINMAGIKQTPIKRLWVNSLEPQAVYEGFQNLRDGNDTYNYFIEAQTRGQADWLVGMNLSQLYSLNIQKQIQASDAYSIGRVQTPTLNLIFERQNSIQNFKPQQYKEVELDVKHANGEFKAKLEPNQQFFDENELESFINQFDQNNSSARVKNIETKAKKKEANQLYSLSKLQSEANSKFKASASDTLKAVQKLYESKLLTYPRTDCNYITDQEFKYLKDNLNQYLDFLNIKEDNLRTEPNKRFVNAKKVQEHHAIILTRNVPSSDLANMSDLEKNIYDLVAKATVAMFLPQFEYEETRVEVMYQNQLFIGKGSVPLNLGWKSLYRSTSSEDKDSLLPKMNMGDVVIAEIETLQKTTKPPKAFTEGTLITAMKTAGKLMDDPDDADVLKDVEGIGTEATRAGIIESLKNHHYIEVKKNKIEITNKGNLICSYIQKVPMLKSAEMTAKWEKFLNKIGNAESHDEAKRLQTQFINQIKKFIQREIEQSYTYLNDEQVKQALIKQKSITDAKKEAKNIGNCKCGGKIVDRGKFWGCSNYKECPVGSVPKEFAKKRLPKKEVLNLFNQHKTGVMTFTSKAGKPYQAHLTIETGKNKKISMNYEGKN